MTGEKEEEEGSPRRTRRDTERSDGGKERIARYGFTLE